MKCLWRLTVDNQRGSIFIAGLVLVMIMTLLGMALFDLSRFESALAIGDAASSQVLYCAEAALGRTMVDQAPGGRIDQINIAAATTPGSTLAWNETVTTNAGTCTNAITFTDDTATVPVRRLLQASSTGPNGIQRSVRVQLVFLAVHYEYVAVGNAGDFYLGAKAGDPAGPPPSAGPGGGDIINGDIFVNGRILVGSPASSAVCSGGPCSGANAVLNVQVNPRSTTDTRATVSVRTGSTWSQLKTDNSNAWPSAGDPTPFGFRPDMPNPDVAAYVSSVMAAAGSGMTGTYQGIPVFNLSAIFATLGANSNGSLTQPSGCSCGGSPSGNCGTYCQLQPLGVMKNPSDRVTENTSTTGNDYYLDGTQPGGELISGKSGQRGAQRLVDFAAVSGQPPIILADGNIWFNSLDSYGFAINGRATIVATNDVLLSDNMIYKDGLSNTNSATADMLGLVGARDIWYGDPRFGTFYEGSGIMLAGRDFNFVFYDSSLTPKTPDNAITLNGTMLANRQIAVFRDFANPSNPNATCAGGTTGCQPIRFDPSNTSCGSADGCWRFIARDANGNITFDATKAPFRECRGLGACAAGTAVISHYQMTLNYDNRLFPGSSLTPPGLPGGAGLIFANSWRDWQECPPCQ